MHRAVVVASLFPLLLTAACPPPCAAVPPESELDYADEEAWACRPGRDDACSAADLTTTALRADGSAEVVAHERAADPAVDCFWVYPTLDLRPGTNVHTDFRDTSRIESSIVAQAGRLSEVCALHAPLYRQVTVGTYLSGNDENRERCFDLAFDDVRRAFARFLDEQDTPRPFVLAGHSQGAQIVSRLVREIVEVDDALLERLVATMPIGWPVGTAAGASTGGSFERVPLCERADERGCAVAYRSFFAGNDMPEFQERYAEGEEIACSEIADPDGTGDDHIPRVWLPWDNALVTLPEGTEPETQTVLYEDAYAARCVRDGDGNAALELRWDPPPGDDRENPADFDSGLGDGQNGSHLFDLHFGQGALIDLVRRKASGL